MADRTGDLIDVTRQRMDILRALFQEPLDKRSLVDQLDLSRSTVDRGVRELESIDLIRYENGQFMLTLCGRHATRKYSEFEEQMGLVHRFRPFLKLVPQEEFDLEIESLADAELLLPERGDPYAMVNRHIELIRNSTQSQALLPFVGLHAVETAHEAVVEGETEGEIVVTSDIANTFRSKPAYTEPVSEMITTGRFEIYEYDGSIPLVIEIFDEAIQLGVAEDSDPRAYVESRSEAVYSWGKRKYQKYKDQSEPITDTLA